MFDSFISSLKSQRVDVSASLSDIRCRISGWSKSSFNISNQNINRNIENSKSIPKSQSFAIGNSRKLQWPVLGNNNERKWISSLSLESSKANVYSSEACEASEKAVIYNNPTHSLKDEESDDECLIEKFDRASENVWILQNLLVPCTNWFMFHFRGAMIERKYAKDWPWVLTRRVLWSWTKQ